MKILHGPDLHTWLLNYGGRKEEWEMATNYLLDESKKAGVKAVVFPG